MLLSTLTTVFGEEDHEADEDGFNDATNAEELPSEDLLRQLLAQDADQNPVDPAPVTHAPDYNVLAAALDNEFEADAEEDRQNETLDLLMALESEAESDAMETAEPTSMIRISADDFEPGEDVFVIEYDPAGGDPQIDLFADPMGNTLIYCNGTCMVFVEGGDGIVNHSDVELTAMG